MKGNTRPRQGRSDDLPEPDARFCATWGKCERANAASYDLQADLAERPNGDQLLRDHRRARIRESIQRELAPDEHMPDDELDRLTDERLAYAERQDSLAPPEHRPDRTPAGLRRLARASRASARYWARRAREQRGHERARAKTRATVARQTRPRAARTKAPSRVESAGDADEPPGGDEPPRPRLELRRVPGSRDDCERWLDALARALLELHERDARRGEP